MSSEENFCAIDAGVRSFATVWSWNEFRKYAENFASELFSRLISLDRLKSKSDKEKENKRKGLSQGFQGGFKTFKKTLTLKSRPIYAIGLTILPFPNLD